MSLLCWYLVGGIGDFWCVEIIEGFLCGFVWYGGGE